MQLAPRRSATLTPACWLRGHETTYTELNSKLLSDAGEHVTENHGVGGSIPPLGTNEFKALQAIRNVLFRRQGHHGVMRRGLRRRGLLRARLSFLLFQPAGLRCDGMLPVRQDIALEGDLMPQRGAR